MDELSQLETNLGPMLWSTVIDIKRYVLVCNFRINHPLLDPLIAKNKKPT